MRVDDLIPDAAGPRGPSAASGVGVGSGARVTSGTTADVSAHGNAFGALVDAAGALLDRADSAEARFTAHKGGLQEMVVERTRADIALQVAATAAQRTAQSLQTLLGMQL
jgi:hypothetical protein